MHHVDFLFGLSAQLPLLFAQPPVMTLLVIAAIAVLVHQARGVLGRSRSIVFRARANEQTAARRDGEAMSWEPGDLPAHQSIRTVSERDGDAASTCVGPTAAASVASMPVGVPARQDAPHAQGEAHGGGRIRAEAPAEASRRTHAAGIAVRIAMACMIVGAVAGWLAVRAARRRAAV